MSKADYREVAPENVGTLIASIEEDAGEEAARMREEAKAEAERRVSLARQQAAAVVKGAGDQAREQAEAARKRILAGAAMERKRRRLRAREELFEEVLDLVRKELAGRRSDQGYREVLVRLIAEAALGLGAGEALVQAPEDDRRLIDGSVLREAERLAGQAGGMQVRLESSGEPLPYGQGVLLVSSDRSRAFDNLVETRIRRRLPRIRELVEERLFR
ncbi:MAG: V-type ATP synthase subunit E [Spirochaetota bacterium]